MRRERDGTSPAAGRQAGYEAQGTKTACGWVSCLAGLPTSVCAAAPGAGEERREARAEGAAWLKLDGVRAVIDRSVERVDRWLLLRFVPSLTAPCGQPATLHFTPSAAAGANSAAGATSGALPRPMVYATSI